MWANNVWNCVARKSFVHFLLCYRVRSIFCVNAHISYFDGLLSDQIVCHILPNVFISALFFAPKTILNDPVWRWSVRQPTPKTTQAVNMNVDRIYRFFGKPCDFHIVVSNGGIWKLNKLRHETKKAKAFEAAHLNKQSN